MKVFSKFDKGRECSYEGTGKIGLRNLRRVSKEIGETLEDDELQAMIDEFDLDQDGESIVPCNLVDEQEFINIMTDNE
jgi:centrin-3